MTFTYWLPDEQGQKQEYTTSNNSVIIIGANGSGKSHLGAWIEQQDLENVHRIGAQRNLNISFSTEPITRDTSKGKIKLTDGNGVNIQLN